MYKLAHVGIAVQDIQRSQQFYTQVLGCSINGRQEMPHLILVTLQCGDQILELLQYDPEPVSDRQTGHIDHIALAVDDMDQAMNRLSEAGITFAADYPVTTPWGQKIAFFTGPDGERIELVEGVR